MRVVGIDLGTRRVGVAVSDDRAAVATPHAVLERTADAEADRAALVALVRELGAGMVVVGLPLSLDGTVGPAARWAGEEADALASLLDVPLELHDERLTTRQAQRTGGEADEDSRAAAHLLDGWLAAQPGAAANRSGASS